MLIALAIRDVVLIDRIALSFLPGLCVLTGETGAGKSILLDALGLALGMRGSAALVRPGADAATVIAEFGVDADAPLCALLAERGVAAPEPGEPLILRRVLGADGRSRAFINDQAVSIALMREAGEALVEIEGQFASHGLMDPASHRAALDGFAGLAAEVADVARLWRALAEAEKALDSAEADIARARADEDWLRHAAAELAALDPQEDEETELAGQRAYLMHGEKLVAAMAEAEKALTDRSGVPERIGSAMRTLERQGQQAAGRLDAVIESLSRAADATEEALAALRSAMADAEPDPQRLESCEERLFALRAAARKHSTTVEALPALRERLEAQLGGLEEATGALQRLALARNEARAAYEKAATALSAKRQKAAAALDAAVSGELPPLRLEKARFVTVVEPRGRDSWGEHGIDRARFEVSTNPGMPTGPIDRIASGGELARFLLALKVVLHAAHAVPTLVFDEVDSGIGGATAAAVGERLARLADGVQVLAITHSPQVAAFGSQHLRVAKSERAGGTVTAVDELAGGDRREEIARMLAGASITDEARAAADSLMADRSR
ncbi:MAG: DNA repair protein RecN [Alphaproteobacteria bacterium]|nr:DNA repair protein RecN [Alphaproteobacteria bacterium]